MGVDSPDVNLVGVGPLQLPLQLLGAAEGLEPQVDIVSQREGEFPQLEVVLHHCGGAGGLGGADGVEGSPDTALKARTPPACFPPAPSPHS